MIYEFSPKQDLHGYAKPWAPGANINILDPDTVTEHRLISNSDGSLVPTAEDYNVSDYIPITEGTTYYFYHVINLTRGRCACWYDEDKVKVGDTVGIYAGGGTTWASGTLTAPEGSAYVRVCYPSSETPAVNYPATETTYTPYANICLPEGYNIWDPTSDKMIQVYAGYVNANTRELYLRPVYEEYAGEELVGPWMSSLDEYSEDTTPTEGAFVIDFGGELTSLEITPFMLQTLLDSLGIRQHFTNGAGLLNSLMDQAQGRVRSEEELLHLSRPLKVIAIGDQLPAGITFKPISKDVLPGLPGKFIR